MDARLLNDRRAACASLFERIGTDGASALRRIAQESEGDDGAALSAALKKHGLNLGQRKLVAPAIVAVVKTLSSGLANFLTAHELDNCGVLTSGGTSLDCLLEQVVQDRPALLQRLKVEMGVAQLSDRRALCNALSRLATDAGMRSQRDTRPLLVYLECGLGNKLRALVSHRRLAVMRDVPLTAVWTADNQCPGGFASLFDPIPDVEVISTAPHDSGAFASCGKSWDYHSAVKGKRRLEARCWAQARPGIDDDDDVASTTLLLRPNAELREMAFQIGISQSDAEYEAFADRYPSHRIFLATDNAATQRRFLRRYGERLHVTAAIGESTNDAVDPSLVTRHTPLRLAVVDMFVCVEAEVFKGSPWSSFSDAIAHMRTVTGRSHAEDEHRLVDPPADAIVRGPSTPRANDDAG